MNTPSNYEIFLEKFFDYDLDLQTHIAKKYNMQLMLQLVSIRIPKDQILENYNALKLLHQIYIEWINEFTCIIINKKFGERSNNALRLMDKWASSWYAQEIELLRLELSQLKVIEYQLKSVNEDLKLINWPHIEYAFWKFSFVNKAPFYLCLTLDVCTNFDRINNKMKISKHFEEQISSRSGQSSYYATLWLLEKRVKDKHRYNKRMFKQSFIRMFNWCMSYIQNQIEFCNARQEHLTCDFDSVNMNILEYNDWILAAESLCAIISPILLRKLGVWRWDDYVAHPSIKFIMEIVNL